jgi:twitching motility protein PilT
MNKTLQPNQPEALLLEPLQKLAGLRASDLHIVANAVPRIRIDGQLIDMPGQKVWHAKLTEQLIFSIMSDEQKLRFAENLELDFSYALPDKTRFRVNLYRQQGEIAAAIRVIPAQILSLEQLGSPAVLADFTEYPRGLVLVTGPTGSGKSTTLAAMISRINKSRAVHIVTVENPIEFTHQSDKALVNQREVGADTHSFADALRHVLRQDPDVVLIGEMRDHETVAAAITAAETGHLVFATLHTQDATQTIDRIVDVFPPDQQDQIRIQLAMTLRGVVSQVLLPAASGKGRVVATEVLVVTPAVANLIRENKAYQIPTIMMAGRELGMQSLDQDLADKVHTRQISVQSAYGIAHDREALITLIGREQGFLAAQPTNNFQALKNQKK